jgi:hypothetical protein
MYTTASGNYGATALGYYTIASGSNGAMAIGNNTISRGNSSFAANIKTTANVFAEAVFGQYNDTTTTGNLTSWLNNDRLFEIGNGIASNSRKNAITVLKNGKVGIGTTNPAARLHVADSSVVFTVTGDVPSTPGPVPISGAGRRMMWYPDKAAFRAGYVSNANWDKDSIGKYSVAMGYSTKAKGYDGAIALGENSTASGNHGATALGYNSTASGDYGSTALGDYSIVSGDYGATALGYYSTASGDFGSTALGEGTIASGKWGATALGFYSTASGKWGATALGYNSIARADISFAANNYTTANAYSEAVFGQYNDTTTTGNLTSWVTTDRLFEIGNGTSSSARSNAVTVLKNGKVGIGVTDPHQMFSVLGSMNIDQADANSGTTANGLFFGNFSAECIASKRTSGGNQYGLDFYTNSVNRISITHTGNIGIGTTSPGYKFTVNGQPAANGYTAFTNYSDARLKKNITNVESCLDKLMLLRPVQYNYNEEYLNLYDDTAALTRTNKGFIAQEVKTIFPEMVGTVNVKGKEYYDLNLSNLQVYMVKGMQEQQMMIDSLKTENADLKARLEKLEGVENMQLQIISQQKTIDAMQKQMDEMKTRLDK